MKTKTKHEIAEGVGMAIGFTLKVLYRLVLKFAILWLGLYGLNYFNLLPF